MLWNMSWFIVRMGISQGQKVDDLQIEQTLTCTNTTCNAQCTAVLPSVLGYEAVE